MIPTRTRLWPNAVVMLVRRLRQRSSIGLSPGYLCEWPCDDTVRSGHVTSQLNKPIYYQTSCQPLIRQQRQNSRLIQSYANLTNQTFSRWNTPSKHEAFTQCCFNVGPASSSLGECLMLAALSILRLHCKNIFLIWNRTDTCHVYHTVLLTLLMLTSIWFQATIISFKYLSYYYSVQSIYSIIWKLDWSFLLYWNC